MSIYWRFWGFFSATICACGRYPGPVNAGFHPPLEAGKIDAELPRSDACTGQLNFIPAAQRDRGYHGVLHSFKESTVSAVQRQRAPPYIHSGETRHINQQLWI